MVYLMFRSVDIPEGYSHIASDWQISTDRYFRDDYIVAKSMNDKIHLTNILFNIDLDPDKIYYARARVIMDIGPSDWSDVDIIKTTDVSKIDLDLSIPSVVGKPDIEIDFPLDRIPSTLFTISTSNISINSDAKHIATNYVITDLYGNVVYSNFNDTANLTKHTISDVKLPENNFYLIKVSHVASSGDVSDFNQKFIYVPDEKRIVLLSSQITENVKENGLLVELKQVDDVKTIYVNLYMVGAGEAVKTYSVKEDKFIFTIPGNVFNNPIGTYLLSLQYEFINGDKTDVKYFKIMGS